MQQAINAVEVSAKVSTMEQLLNLTTLEQAQAYFTQIIRDSSKLASDINQEVEQLHQQVMNFTGGLDDNPKYYEFLLKNVQVATQFDEEADFLEWLIPVWSSARGTAFSREKPVDEFYQELELLILWQLLLQCVVTNEFTVPVVTKMRAIIRRYSNMPALWLYLCKISGEEIKSAYTF